MSVFCDALELLQSFLHKGWQALMVKDVKLDRTAQLSAVEAGEDQATPKTAGRSVALAKPADPVAGSTSPKSRKAWIWAGLVVAVGLGAALWYFQPFASKGLAVVVETVAPNPLMRILAVNGRIAPLHLVEVKPTVSGAVTAVLVEEGDTVKAGDILARIDATQQQAAVRQAMAGLDAGIATQSQAEANLARAKALGGTIARTALEGAQTAEQTAKQDVARLTAQFDQTQIELTKYTLVAPVAGTILLRQAEVGQVVAPAAVVFSVADLGQLVVETDVDEGYAARILPGLPAILQLKGTTEKLKGHVRFVAPQVDAATGGLAVKIAFDAPVVVPVGLTVTANIIVDQLDAAIAVPRAAVATDAAANSSVYVAVQGKAVRRDVTIVDWPANRLEVTSGLVAGDVVITDATGLSDGLAIRLATDTVPGP